MGTAKPRLAVVREEPSPEEALRSIVPDLSAAEAEVARLRNALAVNGRLLAKSRGLAFIREELLRREFGR